MLWGGGEGGFTCELSNNDLERVLELINISYELVQTFYNFENMQIYSISIQVLYW